MSTAATIVQEVYAAFGRGDIPAILSLVASDVDWEFVGSPGLAYAGQRTGPAGVGTFFADVSRTDNIHAFEPREFIEADSHVTVLGWERATAPDTSKDFESEWVHVWTVQDGKVSRWRGFFNTAARYGL
jgi:ketosteroid isomerase-like protein